MTDQEFDPYAELGLGRAASESEVKAAHRKAAKASHPDRADGGDRDKFERVTKAALVLRDPDKRRHYDETGEIDEGGSSQDADLMARISLADQLLHAAIGNCEADFDDVIAMAKALGEKSQANNRNMLASATGERDQLMRLAKRLKHRGDGNDFLASTMADKVKIAEQRMRELEKSIELHQGALELLEQYEWEADERPAPGSFWRDGSTAMTSR